MFKLFGHALKSKYNVISVDSGEECIKRFIEERKRGYNIHPSLLVDYKIGDMSGDSIARKVKGYNEIKIILITAYNLDDLLFKELRESNCIAKFIKKVNSFK